MSIQGLTVGQRLVHKFNGVEDVALVHIDGIEYPAGSGKKYTSLSQAGMAMLVKHGEVKVTTKGNRTVYLSKDTGKERSCGGWQFFNLTNPNARTIGERASKVMDPDLALAKLKTEYDAAQKVIQDKAIAQKSGAAERLPKIDKEIADLMSERDVLRKILGMTEPTTVQATVEPAKPTKPAKK